MAKKEPDLTFEIEYVKSDDPPEDQLAKWDSFLAMLADLLVEQWLKEHEGKTVQQD